MTSYAAFLRAVNVGGTGKLPMETLRAIADGCGFGGVQTYIASGNLVFTSDLGAGEIQAALEAKLAEAGLLAPRVFLRTKAQLEHLIEANPFADQPGNKVVAILLDSAPGQDPSAGVLRQTTEQLVPGPDCLFVCFPDGQGASRIKIPASEAGTGRNMNTLVALLGLLGP